MATFDFNSTALLATQLKLHSIFCALFLKFALSAAELMSFAHSESVILHRRSIICGVPSKISVTPTSKETIDTLTNNIREAIGEIQLLIINNMLKNWNDRVEYCIAGRGSHLNEIIFHY